MLGTVVDRKRGRKRKRRSTGSANGESMINNKGPTSPKPQSQLQQKKITEYFVARRSNRVPKNELEKENALQLHRLILDGTNEKFLEVFDCGVKGRGIRALKRFEKGEFIVEYKGDMINAKLAKLREEEYAKDEGIGSYMYYFKHRNVNYCVDATEESPYKGRLINHSILRPNAKTKVVDFGGGGGGGKNVSGGGGGGGGKNVSGIHLILVARRDIEVGEEILYPYGEVSTAVIEKNPWLVNT